MSPRDDALPAQQLFWNGWNSANREVAVADVSDDQSAVVVRWLDALGRNDLNLIDIGCGTGWLSARLRPYGDVVGTDLADEVVSRASARHPDIRFHAGDFMTLDFAPGSFDVAVSCEVLSHVADQPAFLARIAQLLKPGGRFMIATQNRPALMLNDIPPPAPGQLRHWVDRKQLTRLLGAEFEIEEMFSITPRFNRGALRLLNSRRLNAVVSRAGLGTAMRAVRRLEEAADLGWTLMALARKRREPRSGALSPPAAQRP